MNTKPEALRLADALETQAMTPPTLQAAYELRRLYAMNQELIEALTVVLDDLEYKHHARVIRVANAAIAKSTGENK